MKEKEVKATTLWADDFYFASSLCCWVGGGPDEIETHLCFFQNFQQIHIENVVPLRQSKALIS